MDDAFVEATELEGLEELVEETTGVVVVVVVVVVA